MVAVRIVLSLLAHWYPSHVHVQLPYCTENVAMAATCFAKFSCRPHLFLVALVERARPRHVDHVRQHA